MVQADLRGDGKDVVDADSIYHLLEWTSGRFEFQLATFTDTPRMSMSATQRLMDGAKRIDELAEAQRLANLESSDFFD